MKYCQGHSRSQGSRKTPDTLLVGVVTPIYGCQALIWSHLCSWTLKSRVKVTPEKMRFFSRGVWESFFSISDTVSRLGVTTTSCRLWPEGRRSARARTSNEQLPRPERYTYKVLLLLCGECDGFKHHAWWTPSLSLEAAKTRVEVSWTVAYLRGGGGHCDPNDWEAPWSVGCSFCM